MTSSSASAFASSDREQLYSNDNGISAANQANNHQAPTAFSTIDLDQQPAPLVSPPSLYVSLNDAATFQTDSLSTAGAIPNNLSSSSSQTASSRSFSSRTVTHMSSTPPDRRISVSSAATVAAVSPTIDKLKQWSRTAYKCTKQSIFEKLGKTTRTVDVELEAQIEQLRETKRRYENMLALARSYANHFYNLLQTQRGLSDQFYELKQKSSPLAEEFHYNAETQRLLARSGETLFHALNYFISTMNTLCTKTMEDSIDTIRLYETARLEYDACRTEMALLSPGSQLHDKEYELQKYEEKYKQLKSDVTIKLRLLDENQIKVMKQQLLLFHNAIAAYFSGNKDALEATIKQFHLKVPPQENVDQEKKSFLEQSQH